MLRQADGAFGAVGLPPPSMPPPPVPKGCRRRGRFPRRGARWVLQGGGKSVCWCAGVARPFRRSSFLPAPSGHRQRMIGGARSCRRYRPWRRMPLLSRFTHRRHPLGVSGACLACLVTAARTVPGCPEGAQECPQASEGCRGRPDFLWRVLPVFRRAPAGRCVRCRKHLAVPVSLPAPSGHRQRRFEAQP